MTMSDYGMRSLARAPADPLPGLCRRFFRFVAQAQAANGGAPAVISLDEIENGTGISQLDQIRVRQSLMRNGVLHLSVCNGQWGYSVREALE